MRCFHYDCHQRNHAITANVIVCRVTFRGYRYAPSWMGHLLRRYVYRYRDSKQTVAAGSGQRLDRFSERPIS